MKPKWFYCDVYKENIYFANGWKPEAFKKYFGLETDGARGKAYYTKNGVVIWTAIKDDYVACHHESIHGAMFILEYLGIEISAKNDEALAYLSEYIFRCITGLK